jgi:uncharacterized protein (DUF58 family)
MIKPQKTSVWARPKSAVTELPIHEYLQKARRLELKIRRLVDTALAGEMKSAFRGGGLELDEVRGYQYGDDVRTIDWNVTAKTGQVHVKVFREAREQQVHVLFDVSGSQHFGTQRGQKMQTGTELTAVLALAALHNGDRFGLTLFTDRVEAFEAAARGRGHVLRSIGRLLELADAHTETHLAAAARFIEQTQHKRNILFIVSDFLDTQPFELALGRLALRHDVVLVRLFHPDEALPGIRGFIPVRSLESSTQPGVLTLSGSSKGTNRLESWFANMDKAMDLLARRLQIDYLSIDVTQAWLPPLQELLHRRIARTRKR